MLYACHQHEIWSKRTQIVFTVTLEGEQVGEGPRFALDGENFALGQVVGVGKHRLTITLPEALPFETNFFVWYGKHDLGPIDLKRTRGFLVISVSPAAPRLLVRGSHFSLALTNTTGITSSVPLDTYDIVADYGLIKDNCVAKVALDSGAVHVVRPRLGALVASCNQTGATYELYSSEKRRLSTGDLPIGLLWLQEGPYTLQVRHGKNTKEHQFIVQELSTNIVNIEFSYGAFSPSTEPPGAEILDESQAILGTTPATIRGLLIGKRTITLRKAGYEPVAVQIEVLPEATNVFHTNLVSRTYAGALRAAQTFNSRGDYAATLRAALDALQAKPGDEEALLLQTEALYQLALKRAKDAADRSDFTNAVREVREALQTHPGAPLAQGLLEEYSKQMGLQHEQILRRPSEIFANAEARWGNDGRLFKTQQTKTVMKPEVAREKILHAFLWDEPKISAVKNGVDREDLFDIQGTQEFRGGLRRFLVTGAHSPTNGTHIFYKVMEYKLTGRFGGAKEEIPLDPSDPSLSEQQRKQVSEGAKILRQKLGDAGVLGQ